MTNTATLIRGVRGVIRPDGRDRRLGRVVLPVPAEPAEYWIRQCELRRYFNVFFSSFVVGASAPEKAIYRLVMQGVHAVQTIRFDNAGELAGDLQEMGVDW